MPARKTPPTGASLKNLKRGGQHGVEPGSVTRLSRARADALTAAGETPLDIMIDNMLFWYQRAQLMEDKIARMREIADGDEAGLKRALKLLEQFVAARANAQSCAVDAAPYMHPKLQSLALTNPNDKVTRITMELPLTSEGEARSYRDGWDLPGQEPEKVAADLGALNGKEARNGHAP